MTVSLENIQARFLVLKITLDSLKQNIYHMKMISVIKQILCIPAIYCAIAEMRRTAFLEPCYSNGCKHDTYQKNDRGYCRLYHTEVLPIQRGQSEISDKNLNLKVCIGGSSRLKDGVCCSGLVCFGSGLGLEYDEK